MGGRIVFKIGVLAVILTVHHLFSVEPIKQRYEAARQIQRVWRGHRVRKQLYVRPYATESWARKAYAAGCILPVEARLREVAARLGIIQQLQSNHEQLVSRYQSFPESPRMFYARSLLAELENKEGFVDSRYVEGQENVKRDALYARQRPQDIISTEVWSSAPSSVVQGSDWRGITPPREISDMPNEAKLLAAGIPRGMIYMPCGMLERYVSENCAEHVFDGFFGGMTFLLPEDMPLVSAQALKLGGEADTCLSPLPKRRRVCRFSLQKPEFVI